MEPTQPLTVDLWTKTRLHTGHYQAATEAKKAIGASKSWDDAAKNLARAEVDKFFAADKDKEAPKSVKASKPSAKIPAPPVTKIEDKKEEEVKKAKQAGSDAADAMLRTTKEVPDKKAEERQLNLWDEKLKAMKEANAAASQGYSAGAEMRADRGYVTYQDLMQTAAMAKDMPGDTWGKIAERVAVLILARLS